MKVRDAMAQSITCARPGDTISRIAQIMKSEDTGFVPVVEGEKLVGVVTDRDIVVRCLAESHDNPLQERVDHVMSRDVETVSPEDDLQAAAEKMAGEEIRRLAVVDGGRVVGVLSHGNLVQAEHGEVAHRATEAVTSGA